MVQTFRHPSFQYAACAVDAHQRRPIFLRDPEAAIGEGGYALTVRPAGLRCDPCARKIEHRLEFGVRAVRDGQAANGQAIRAGQVQNLFEHNPGLAQSKACNGWADGGQRHDLCAFEFGEGRQMLRTIILRGRFWLDVGAAISDAPENVRIIQWRLAQARCQTARQSHFTLRHGDGRKDWISPVKLGECHVHAR